MLTSAHVVCVGRPRRFVDGSAVMLYPCGGRVLAPGVRHEIKSGNLFFVYTGLSVSQKPN